MKGKGWRGESHRHSLAARGIKSNAVVERRKKRQKVKHKVQVTPGKTTTKSERTKEELAKTRAGLKKGTFDLRSHIYTGFGFANIEHNRRPFWKIIPTGGPKGTNLNLISQIIIDSKTGVPYVFRVSVTPAAGADFRPDSYEISVTLDRFDKQGTKNHVHTKSAWDLKEYKKVELDSINRATEEVDTEDFDDTFKGFKSKKLNDVVTEADLYEDFVNEDEDEYERGMPTIIAGHLMREFNYDVEDALLASNKEYDLLSSENLVSGELSSVGLKDVHKPASGKEKFARLNLTEFKERWA